MDRVAVASAISRRILAITFREFRESEFCTST